jgi:hypothetical protein
MRIVLASAAALLLLLAAGTLVASWQVASSQIVPNHGEHIETVLAVQDAPSAAGPRRTS